MTNDEYIEAMDILAAAARIILTVDIEQMRDDLAKSETLAPILEPTAFIRGGDNRMREQREFLDAMANVKAVCLKFKAAGAPL